MKYKCIVILASNSHATLLYKNLLSKGCSVELIAAPSIIKRGCNKAVRFDESDIDIVIQEIQNSKLIIRGIYKIVRETNRTSYVLIS